MSHTIEIKSEIYDFKCMEDAFEELGWKLKEKSKIRTYSSDPDRNVVYDWIAVNPQNGYDLGIKQVGDQFKIYGDFYDGSIQRQLGSDLGTLKQKYTVNVLKKHAEENDLEYELHTNDNGEMEITILS